MIRYRLRERIADLEFRTGRKVTLTEIQKATGINQSTLSKLSTRRGYNTTTDVLDRLCEFFNCELSQLAEYVPNEQVE